MLASSRAFSVCIFVCVCACVRACVRACARSSLNIHTHTHTHVYIYSRRATEMVKPRARSWSLGRLRPGKQRRSFCFSIFFIFLMLWAGCSLCQGLESRGILSSPFFFFAQGCSLSQGLERKKNPNFFFAHRRWWMTLLQSWFTSRSVSVSLYAFFPMSAYYVCVCVCIHTYRQTYVGWLPRYYIYRV